MKWIRSAAIALGLTLAASAAVRGQQTPFTMRLQHLVASRMRLAVVSGRITNTSGWLPQSTSSNTRDGTTQEQISFQGNGQTGSIKYDRTAPDEQFTLEVSSEGRFFFRRTPVGGSSVTPVQFSQAAGEPLLLTIGAEGQQRVYRGATIWHLLLSQPDECKQYFIPILDLLHPQQPRWDLARTATAIEAELVKGAGTNRPERQQWEALVQQLGDNGFTRREAADRQLRAVGPPIVGYLQGLNFDRLDAEQQFRIRRIIKALSRQAGEETAEQIAGSLAGDTAIWLALLERPGEASRRAAVKQLAAFLGEDVRVDPAADPATQKEQREQLRARIERAQPTPEKSGNS